MSAYGISTRTDLSVEDAESRVRERLAEEGFGVLTEIDLAATLKAKLGIDRPAYKILGACSPPLAAQAVEAEADIGLLLPCNVVVYADGDETVVAALDPGMMVDLTDNLALDPVATEVRSRLRRVIASIGRD